MLETTYTLRLYQLLKITPDLKNVYVAETKAIKVISEPNVTIVVETHSKLDTTTIEVDNQMAVIQVQVGKNIVEDVLLDGGANVNIVTKNFKQN
jgi:hypothetical protein